MTEKQNPLITNLKLETFSKETLRELFIFNILMPLVHLHQFPTDIKSAGEKMAFDHTDKKGIIQGIIKGIKMLETSETLIVKLSKNLKTIEEQRRKD